MHNWLPARQPASLQGQGQGLTSPSTPARVLDMGAQSLGCERHYFT